VEAKIDKPPRRSNNLRLDSIHLRTTPARKLPGVTENFFEPWMYGARLSSLNNFLFAFKGQDWNSFFVRASNVLPRNRRGKENEDVDLIFIQNFVIAILTETKSKKLANKV